MGRRNERQWTSMAASFIFAALVCIIPDLGKPVLRDSCLLPQVSDFLCHLP